jgi:hypothetical protein
VRRLLATITVALCLSGCRSFSGQPVDLLTGVEADTCYAGGESGATAALLVDPRYGTSFNGNPVMWPNGYSARRDGAEVVVFDAGGRARAITGRIYHISIAPVWTTAKRELLERIGAFPAAVNCSYPWDFIDCTADPANQYCLPESR